MADASASGRAGQVPTQRGERERSPTCTPNGKSGKGKDGSKGKDFPCHKCGKHGHFARDCRVRAVGQDESATAQTGEKTNSGSNATSGTVNRVSFAPSSTAGFWFVRDGRFEQYFHVTCQHGFKTTYKPKPFVQHSEQFSTTFSGESFFGEELEEISKRSGANSEEFPCCADEFTKDSTGLDVSADVFTFQTLFQDDDFDHFRQRVFSDYSLHLYDVVGSDSGGRNLKRFDGEFQLQTCAKRLKHDSSLDCTLRVRAISTCRTMDIILDSGSDVTLIPACMAGLGTQVSSQPETYLRDAQGQRIATHDVRDVNYVFHARDGSVANVKEHAFFSDTIDSPLISFGKLVKAGWGIETSRNGTPMLAHPSGTRVELAFRNSSLTISGTVRVVQHVRKIGVDITRSWQSLRQGWYEADNLQICSSGGSRFVDATTDYRVNGWPFRTTVGFHDTRSWEVIALCERLFSMEDRAAAVQGNYHKLLTILSKDVMSVADFGVQMECKQLQLVHIQAWKLWKCQFKLSPKMVQLSLTFHRRLQFNPACQAWRLLELQLKEIQPCLSWRLHVGTFRWVSLAVSRNFGIGFWQLWIAGNQCRTWACVSGLGWNKTQSRTSASGHTSNWTVRDWCTHAYTPALCCLVSCMCDGKGQARTTSCWPYSSSAQGVADHFMGFLLCWKDLWTGCRGFTTEQTHLLGASWFS